MDEEKIKRNEKSTRKKIRQNFQIKEKEYASKLKNETSKSEFLRKKFRTDQRDSKSEILEEQKHHERLRSKRKKKGAVRHIEVLATERFHNVISEENQDDNAGVEALNTGSQMIEGSLYSAKIKNYEKQTSGYGKKIHEKNHFKEGSTSQRMKESSNKSNLTSKQLQKNRIKKELQSQAYKERAKSSVYSTRGFVKKVALKSEDVTGKIIRVFSKFVAEHPVVCIIALLVLLIILLVSAIISSCGMCIGGISNVTIGTSYIAEDETITKTNEDYKKLEDALQKEIAKIETDYPGYDEYNYSLNEISHNPFALAALLTVLYEDYSQSEVQAMLQKILDVQYKLTKERIVETRTRTVTKWHWVTKYRIEVVNGISIRVPYQSYESYQEEEEYEYTILNVTLTNHSIDYVVRNIGLTEEQIKRYELLIETYGNKKYLFEDDHYAIPTPGDYQDYDVPSEYLTDVEFANMLKEAEKYLGYPYVWGGASPSTSFDCSGFVSYVINHCGNGWNVGRQTADGLLSKCSRIPRNKAKPGDLIFFEGTYNTPGASHVGIYVGDGMMIHCGNPIKYASINSSYWSSHFYTFGRLKH